MARSAQTQNTAASTPAGRDAAASWPWWKTGLATVLPGRQREYVVRDPWNTTGRPVISNRRPYPIVIDELRVWATGTKVPGTNYFLDRILMKLGTPRDGAVNARYLPVPAFNTEEDRHLCGWMDSVNLRFPSPIYMQRGQSMLMGLYATDPATYGEKFQAVLRGVDPTNNSPISIASRITTAIPGDPPLPGVDIPQARKAEIAFDDGRDVGIRDMWGHDLNIAWIDARAGDPPNGWMRWPSLGVSFEPAEGPQWTEDLWTPLVGLAEQVPAYSVLLGAPGEAKLCYQPPMIHRPIEPYVLMPTDSLDLSFMVTGNMPESGQDMFIWVCARGRAKGGA